jgi:putative SOS response-associated peptidase YedK
MCNHYRLREDLIPTWAEYAGFNVRATARDTDAWPRRQAAIARIDDGARVIDTMQWGVPLTMPGKREGTTVTKRITNVRNLTSSFWKSMLATPARRCLVPFSEFAEPKIGHGREEHWFTVNDRPVGAFAGIWRPTEEGDAFAFLTTEPNPLVAPLHPKAMPVVLDEADYDRWLTADYADAIALAQPFPSQLMAVR